MNYEKIVRKIRNGDALWSENDIIAEKAYRVLGKAKTKMLAQRVIVSEKIGQWSGMTRSELSRSGTIETDWY